MIKNHFPKVNTFWKSEVSTGEFEGKKNFQAEKFLWKGKRRTDLSELQNIAWNLTDQLEKREKATCFPRPTHSLSSGLKIPEVSDIWYLKGTWEHTVLGNYNGCGSSPEIGLLENGLKGIRDLIIFLSRKGTFILGLEEKCLRVKLEISQKPPVTMESLWSIRILIYLVNIF